MGGFVVLAMILGMKIIPRLALWVDSLPVSEGVMAFVVIVTLLFAWSAEVVGTIAAITGAFLAGLSFAHTSVRHTVEQGMHTLTYAFFVPIFLISIGLKANARTLGVEGVAFAVAIIVVAILAKMLGGGLGARLGGFNSLQALRVGIGMISRGEVGLIVAAIGLSEALIGQEIYSTMVVMVLVTTLVTPICLSWVFPKAEGENG
jgi:Kef-type K+ transport system membrane component KefB